MRTAYKKVSSHGSINIPAAMRRELATEAKDPMVVEEHNGAVLIRPYTPRCSFCRTMEDVQDFMGRGICSACARKIAEKSGGHGWKI